MVKKATLLGLLGYLAGCIIAVCFELQNESFAVRSALSHILLGGIPGAVIMGSSVIYDIEKWSILRVTVTHFLITMGTLLSACFVLKWYKPWSVPFWIMTAAELVGYFIIWLIMYLRCRSEVRKLNEMLKRNMEK